MSDVRLLPDGILCRIMSSCDLHTLRALRRTGRYFREHPTSSDRLQKYRDLQKIVDRQLRDRPRWIDRGLIYHMKWNAYLRFKHYEMFHLEFDDGILWTMTSRPYGVIWGYNLRRWKDHETRYDGTPIGWLPVESWTPRGGYQKWN